VRVCADATADSIILGLFRHNELEVSVTLNTITDRFPGLAMELEKQVSLDHPYFRRPDALELSKLVASETARCRRGLLHILYAVFLVARAFNKRHFRQVSRDLDGDISWRERFGFDHSNRYRFNDPSLNGMPSRTRVAARACGVTGRHRRRRRAVRLTRCHSSVLRPVDR
jgi:hypothetical protein